MSRGRKSDHAAPIAWALAVEIAGNEARLVKGVPARTWQWWRSEDAVPAYRVLPFLLARYVAARPPVRLVRPGEGASRPRARGTRA